ncbi:hypothetical protein ACN4D1_05180 [Corynebacterium macclintockiae]|uniref:hypothetical protein n=1 Tax=Corynebacterium TaxID=1716 RepID=UPI0038D130D4
MIYDTWQNTRDREYLDPTTGEPSPVRGGLQLVFSDIGTPSDRWNAYDELAAQLTLRGMPADAIRFMHEAKTDVEKAKLFAAARAGHIAVLIGSTGKMGVGTNVQRRAVALYHLDCPWRPADIAQREGRILRQGNQNEQVAIVRLVTEHSFDSYMWQGVERKATFIAQIMRGSLDAREIEEIDSSALSAAEAKAISSGNPLLLDHATIQTEVTRLRRLERAHERSQAMLAHTRPARTSGMPKATSRACRRHCRRSPTPPVTGSACASVIGATTRAPTPRPRWPSGHSPRTCDGPPGTPRAISASSARSRGSTSP